MPVLPFSVYQEYQTRQYVTAPLPRPEGCRVRQLLEMYDRGRQEEAALRHKWENYSWGLLQGLMERE